MSLHLNVRCNRLNSSRFQRYKVYPQTRILLKLPQDCVTSEMENKKKKKCNDGAF